MLSGSALHKAATPLLTYIDQHWAVLTRNARDGNGDRLQDWAELAKSSYDGHLDDLDPAHPYILYLPQDFVTPGGRFVVQFYWDSFFILLGLLDNGHLELARGMVENCFHLIDHHGVVIANRKRWAAGSQLPFLTSMVREVFAKSSDREWLRTALTFIEQEYWEYWLNDDHRVYRGLSRYHAPAMYPAEKIPEITIDHEASWDLSPRFEAKDVLELLPVDLNCNLYRYERDLAEFRRLLGENGPAAEWERRAVQRGHVIRELMWDPENGFFYDYNFVDGRKKDVRSLAGYFPLLHGIASQEQAKRCRERLAWFEHAFGLTACDKTYGFTDRQWNYPVGWAPLHWAVAQGLNRYGFSGDGRRVALKWLNLNLSVWQRTGALFEKYDVVAGSEGVLEDRYANQQGFGWTNGVFVRLMSEVSE